VDENKAKRVYNFGDRVKKEHIREEYNLAACITY